MTEAVRVPVSKLPGKVVQGVGATAIKPQPWWPRQSLYHGTLYSVPPGGGGRPDARPAASSVKLALGTTEVESMAALAA